MRQVISAFIFIFVLLAPTIAIAHKFDIAIVAPFSGPNMQEGNNLWNGMRVATKEFDGHAFETSDGHLGGVDSNLIRIDSTQNKDLIAQQLKELGYQQKFIIAVMGPDQLILKDLLPQDIANVLIFTGEEQLSAQLTVLTPGLAVGNARKLFDTQFLQQYLAPSDHLALAGYSAARLISAAILPIHGDLTDARAVQDSFYTALHRPEF